MQSALSDVGSCVLWSLPRAPQCIYRSPQAEQQVAHAILVRTYLNYHVRVSIVKFEILSLSVQQF